MNIEPNNKTLKRPNDGPLLPERVAKRQKFEHISEHICEIEISDTALDPARFTVAPAEFFSTLYDVIREQIFPYLESNDILALRGTTTNWKNNSELILIEALNDKTLLLKDLNLDTIDDVCAFFDKNCEKITVLNLAGFEDLALSDIDELLEFFPNIEELTINCPHEPSLQSIFYLSQMQNLKKLNFRNCIEKPKDSPGEIKECEEEKICWSQCTFPKLEELIVYNSDMPEEFFPSLKQIKTLKTLHFFSESLPQNENLCIESPYLKEITIQGAACEDDHFDTLSINCASLQKLLFKDIIRATNLIIDCPILEEIKLKKYSLANNVTVNCPLIENFKWIQTISYDLENLTLYCPLAEKLQMEVHCAAQIFYNIPSVEELEIFDQYEDSEILGITLFAPSLKKFSGSNTQDLNKFIFLSSTENLKSFSLTYIESEDLSFLSNSTALEELTLRGPIKDFSALANLTQITQLDLSDCKNLTDISFIKQMPKIETIKLKNCFGIKNIEILAEIPSLQKLTLGNTELVEIAPADFAMIFTHYAEDQNEYNTNKVLDDNSISRIYHR